VSVIRTPGRQVSSSLPILVHIASRKLALLDWLRTAGYLKPIFGCLHRNRREVFAAAVARYLKSVYAAEPVGIGDSSVGRYSESDHGK